ncbi:hypothetical protein C1H46_011869 [Malus baccata]|uniref:non-specific serine/threonine protein kinase n=1 Tax=Malus baccata TaxID=106549 RepID=A0A540MUL9_MALBA|nr:hypothetical protein C1H46_011869 [Malus baccata]
MSKPSLRLHLTKLVLYHSLLWQLGQWPQSKFHCNADNEYPLPDNEVSALQNIMDNSKLRQEQHITKQYCQNGTSNYDFTIRCSCDNMTKECRISRITCENYNFELEFSVSRDLWQNQLSGQIPASLGSCGSLEQLVLGYNLLSGAIPQSFGSLKNLRRLDLKFNRLSGSIPRAFGDFPNLTNIVLSENRFTGPLPEGLGNLTSLTSFYVSANYLSGKFPEGYDKLTSLEEFSIIGNYISGPLPVKTIAKWTNINYLGLVGNNFEGWVTEEIFNLPNLAILKISDLANDGFQLPPKINNPAKFVTLSFSGNKLNGTIPRWILEASQTSTDLSFNNFSAIDIAVPSNPQLNLFACCRNSSITVPERMDPFEMKNTYCPENKPKFHSLFINCGGEETTVLGNKYDQDNDTSLYYTSPMENWAYSLSGDFGAEKSNASDYIKNMTCGISVTEALLYEKARLSPQSLKYYAFCLLKGGYNVTLYFNEIVYVNDADYTSLRKRIFDVYIQGEKRLNNFDIREKAGIVEKPITEKFSAVAVHDSGLLEIHLYWPGKGSYDMNGPLISAISVTPEFEINPDKHKRQRVALITIASIVAALLLLLAFAWRMGWLSRKEIHKIKIGQEKIDDELQDKFVTVKELIRATNNFSDKKKLDRSGTVFMAKLQEHTVAVKRLGFTQFKEKIEELKIEIGTIRSMQHINVLELLDVYIGKDHQLLVYEYMENKSLADNLFDSSTSSKLKLNWETRVNICLGIANGLKYLHEHPRVKILHTNIKSTNILLNENLEAKISDFGFASLYTEGEKVMVIKREVPLGYMAPEYFQTDVLTSKSDVYSFGVVMLELVSGKRNKLSKSKEETQVLLDKAHYEFAEGNLKCLVDNSLAAYDEREALTILKLAVYCTNLAPSVRPTISEVVSVLVRRKSLDEVFPPAKLTGDINVAGSS